MKNAYRRDAGVQLSTVERRLREHDGESRYNRSKML